MYSLPNIRCMVPYTLGFNLVPDSLNSEYLKLKQCVVVGSPTTNENEPVIVLLVSKLSVVAARRDGGSLAKTTGEYRRILLS
jgi:hypothetical protein